MDSLVSLIPARFRAYSGTYLFKQGENCHGSIVWIECSHGSGELLGLSPGRAMCFFLLSMTSFDVGHRNKHQHPGFGASIQEESHRSRYQNHSGVVTRIVTFFV